MVEATPMMLLAAMLAFGQEPASTTVYTASHGELARKTSLASSFACTDGRVIDVDLETSDAGAIRATRMTYQRDATPEELQTITEGLSPVVSLFNVDVACYPRGGISIQIHGTALDEQGNPGRWASSISWTEGVGAGRPVFVTRRINGRDVTAR